MNKEYIIRHQIERVGSTVELTDGEWISVPFKALISPLWRKKSSDFEINYTELGADLSEYYLYIGSADHCITQLSDDAMLRQNGILYEFKRRDTVTFDDEVLYFIGVLRRLKGDMEDDD